MDCIPKIIAFTPQRILFIWFKQSVPCCELAGYHITFVQTFPFCQKFPGFSVNLTSYILLDNKNAVFQFKYYEVDAEFGLNLGQYYIFSDNRLDLARCDNFPKTFSWKIYPILEFSSFFNYVIKQLL